MTEPVNYKFKLSCLFVILIIGEDVFLMTKDNKYKLARAGFISVSKSDGMYQ